MKNYNQFHVEDFVQDPYFRQWVLGELPKNDSFWDIWVQANPEKKEVLDEARTLIIALQIEESPLATHEIQYKIEQIFEATTQKRAMPFYQNRWFRAAAMLVLVSSASLWIYRNLKSPLQPVVISTQTENESPKPMTIALSDGSKVTVEHGSKLRVDKNFGKTNRTVYLVGEAFFEVERNPEKPFLVVTDNLVTKVLGTSFRIKAYQKDPNISVSVRTGKVTVFKQNADSGITIPAEQMVLMPNQQAVFLKSEAKLVKTLVEKPVLLVNNTAETKLFEFEETPITSVFSTLEKAYGVKIDFDAELLKNCNLTASLANEPLYEKLDLICETIEAHYEIADGQVVVFAKGCK
jgi:transmembrane sensor